MTLAPWGRASTPSVTRPAMRAAPVKSAGARHFLIRRQTRTVNTIGAHPAAFGITVAKGIPTE